MRGRDSGRHWVLHYLYGAGTCLIKIISSNCFLLRVMPATMPRYWATRERMVSRFVTRFRRMKNEHEFGYLQVNPKECSVRKPSMRSRHLPTLQVITRIKRLF